MQRKTYARNKHKNNSQNINCVVVEEGETLVVVRKASNCNRSKRVNYCVEIFHSSYEVG